MQMCVHTCRYVWIYAYMQICAHICVYICIYACRYAYMHTYMCIRAHICIYAYDLQIMQAPQQSAQRGTYFGQFSILGYLL